MLNLVEITDQVGLEVSCQQGQPVYVEAFSNEVADMQSRGKLSSDFCKHELLISFFEDALCRGHKSIESAEFELKRISSFRQAAYAVGIDFWPWTLENAVVESIICYLGGMCKGKRGYTATDYTEGDVRAAFLKNIESHLPGWTPTTFVWKRDAIPAG